MRSAVLSTVVGASGPLGGLGLGPSLAYDFAPAGYRLQKDKLDGYSFLFPEDWVRVTSTAADIFFRSIDEIETNVFVEFSSASSSAYKSVRDLGTPMQAAERIREQYVVEFMSSRIGVRRQAKIMSAEERMGSDGMLFYDISVNINSYADTNQFGIAPEERISTLEFDRRLFTTLGVNNGQLYEMRLQTPESKVSQQSAVITPIMESLRLFTPTDPNNPNSKK